MMRQILERYVPLVDFLATVLGPSHEVVLHDLTNLEHSIVAIQNGHVSGRQVGSPATNLVLKIMQDETLQKQEFVSRYQGYSTSGKLLRSSTFFIKEDGGQIVGMLCVNSDLTNIHKFIDAIAEFVNLNELESGETVISENLSTSIEDLTTSSVQSILLSKNVEPERMTPEEKMEIVQELYQKGTFLLKGAVSEVATHLKTSEATIYRYLQKIK